MSDSPMIQVLKYLEAGNRIYRRFQTLSPMVYRFNPLPSRQCVEWCDGADVGSSREQWVPLATIGILADLLPFIPQKPDLPKPTTHIRKVEL